MAMIKASQAGAILKEAIVLDLGDIGRQAAKLQAGAAARAAQIEAQARQRAELLTRNASSEGFEQGRAEGFQQGLEEGREQGRAQAFVEAQAQLQALESQWLEAAQAWDQRRQTLERDARRDVLELALRLTEKIVHRVVQVDPRIIESQFTAALAHVLGPYDVVVHLHPEDRGTLTEAVPRVMAQAGRFKSIELVEDAAIQRGGCVVTYGQGAVDARLETQLCRMVELLLPSAAAEPSELPEVDDSAPSSSDFPPPENTAN